MNKKITLIKTCMNKKNINENMHQRKKIKTCINERTWIKTSINIKTSTNKKNWSMHEF